MKKILLIYITALFIGFPVFAAELDNLIPKPETKGLDTVKYTPLAPTLTKKCYVFERKTSNFKTIIVNGKAERILIDCDAQGNISSSDKKTYPPEEYQTFLQQTVEVNWLSQHINLIYTASLSFGTVICVIFIMWAGLRWIAAGGNQEIIGQSKERISNGLIGLVLLFGSYLILYTINPETTNLKNIKVEIPPKLQFLYTPLLEIEALAKKYDVDFQNMTEQQRAALESIQSLHINQKQKGFGDPCYDNDSRCSNAQLYPTNGEISQMTCRKKEAYGAVPYCCTPKSGGAEDTCHLKIPLTSYCESTFQCINAITKNGDYNAIAGKNRAICCADMGTTLKDPNSPFSWNVHQCQWATINAAGKWTPDSGKSCNDSYH